MTNKTLTVKELPTLVGLFCLLLLAQTSVAATAAPPKVLTSIKPVQLIAQAITEGVSDSDVLLPPGASPHSHSLRPSDARKLHDADVVFWVGPDMETFLGKMLSNATSTRSVELIEAKGLHLRHGDEDSNDEGEHHHHDDHGHKHHHHHDGADPHIWLSPENAKVMARTMSATLSELDPDNAKTYTANLVRFQNSLDQLDSHNKKRLAPLAKQPFFVFHDAYGYFQEHYHLTIGGHFTLTPEQQPGARHLSELRNKLASSGKTCVFREPQFQPAYIDRLIDGLDVNVSVLDPLGMDIPVGPDGYSTFINSLVDSIVDCKG